MNRRTTSAMVAATCLLAQNAWAGPIVDQSAGLKLSGGADLWTAPSNVPVGPNELGFKGSAGGFSYGFAGYYELRLIKFLGVEAGLTYQLGSFQRKVTSGSATEYTETVSTKSLRFPLLAKLNLPVGLGRFWLGLGPEFTLAQSSSAKVEITSGPPGPIPLSETTRDVNPTFLTTGLGLVIEIPGVGLDIPLEFRASKNLSQPSAYGERVTSTAGAAAIQAESSWVLRLGAGLGYRF